MKDECERITWGEISAQASSMFRVWYFGSELEWCKECWNILGEADLTGSENDYERSMTLLRLLALARIYQEFSGLKWDENPETPIVELAEDLDIDPFILGIVAAKASPESFDESGDSSDLMGTALYAATDALRKEIFECLCKSYGDEFKLYTRMSKTNKCSVDEDEEDEEDGDEDRGGCDEFEISKGNALGLNYVLKGFREG